MQHIIIVDDALDLGRVLQTMLLTLDPSLWIHVVPSAEEAMLETGQHRVDLLVTDIRLPGMTGVDLVRKIRIRQPDLKAIIITGISDDRLIQQAKDIKPDALLRKPLDFPQFLEKARACLALPGPVRPPVAVLQPTSQSQAEKSKTAPLPTEPASRPLYELIANLRTSLAARTVLILSRQGRVVVQDGTALPVDLEATWAPQVFETLASTARLSRLVDAATFPHALAFTGPDYTLVVAPVDELALLLVLKKGRSAMRLSLAVEEALAAQTELAAALKAISNPLPTPAVTLETATTPTLAGSPGPVPAPGSAAPPPAAAPYEAVVQAAAAEAPAAPDPQATQLEEILNQPASSLKPDEIDAYWDSLLDSSPTSPDTPGGLNYNQAAELGLTPKKSS